MKLKWFLCGEPMSTKLIHFIYTQLKLKWFLCGEPMSTKLIHFICTQLLKIGYCDLFDHENLHKRFQMWNVKIIQAHNGRQSKRNEPLHASRTTFQCEELKR